MANTGFKGIDVRQTGTALLFRAFLQDSAGAILTSGTTTLYIYELQSDGTLSSYDFSSNTFKTTALTTETLALTHRTGNNSTTSTGVWTAALATLTGFTVGGVYLARVKNTGATPTDQVREFQYGSDQGDITTTAGATGVAYVQSDLRMTLGAASAGVAGYVGLDWSHVNAPTTTLALTGTTISTGQVVASVAGAVGSVAGVTFPANFGLTSIDTGGAIKIQGSIKKNQALAGFAFYLALSSDHVSPATSKLVTATRSLNGAAFAACANAAVEIGAGWYAIDLAATDLNGNVVALSFAAALCDTTSLTVATQP